MTTKRPFAMPDVFVILFVMAAFLALLSHVVPAGVFEVQQVNGKPRLIPESFRIVEDWTGVALFGSGDTMGFLNFVFEGMVSGSKQGSAIGVVAFILVIGGAFGMIMHTGAIHRGLTVLIRRRSNHLYLLMPLLFLLFSLGGAVFGMGEEAIAFCILLTPLLVRLGYDSICAVMVTYVATQIGFGTSWMNPFGVAIAQGIAGIPVGSGAELRLVMWATFTLFGIVYLMRYANWVKANPGKSLAWASDQKHFLQADAQPGAEGEAKLSRADQLILLTLAAGMVWVTWGVLAWGYYIPEIASQFFSIGLACGLIGWVARQPGCDANNLAGAFRQGAADLLPAALVVALAKGLVLMLGGDNPAKPSVLNTMLFHMGDVLSGLPTALSAWLMLALQSVTNFFVPSGSGQAALVMPLMAPLSDLIGVGRQVAVLAFQLGDGLTNIIIPTSASLVGCLGVCKLDWALWFRFIWRFQLWLFSLASAFVIGAVVMGYA
jgi:uncharacterized ion transporter superfamily protein YfcC